MKKVGVGFVVGILLTVLTGCGPSGTPEENYVREIRKEVQVSPGVSDREIISNGQTICDSLADGIGEKLIVDLATGNGLTAREGHVLIDAAKKYLCEEEN